MIRKLLPFIFIVVALVGVLASQQKLLLESNLTKAMLVKEMTPVQAVAIKPFLFGHEAFYADLFWIHCLRWSVEQGIPNMFEYLYKMTDLITDLDPRFEQVYVWSGFILADATSDKKTYLDKIKASNVISLKGLNYARQDVQGWKHFSRHWMIAQNLAFNYGIELKDKEKALEYTQILMNVPDLPPHMKTWAAGLYRESKEKEKGRNFLEDLLAVETLQARINLTDDEQVKEKLKGKLLAFYNKMDSSEYGYRRMEEIQQRVRNMVEEWRTQYPFLPFPLFTILHSRETEYEVAQSQGMYGLFFKNLGGNQWTQ